MFIGANVTSGLGDSTDAMTEQLDVSLLPLHLETSLNELVNGC